MSQNQDFNKSLEEDFVQYSSNEGKEYLYNPTKFVKDIKSPKIQQIIEKMKAHLEGKGIGLAANQLGFPYQIFIIEYKEENKERRYTYLSFQSVPLQVFINPKSTKVSEEKVSFWHGCLSAIERPRGLVSTYRWIEYEAFDEHGNHQTGKLDGIGAIIFQHEFCHLLGSLYIDHAQTFLSHKELIHSFNSGALKPYEIADETTPLLLSNYNIGDPIGGAGLAHEKIKRNLI